MTPKAASTFRYLEEFYHVNSVRFTHDENERRKERSNFSCPDKLVEAAR